MPDNIDQNLTTIVDHWLSEFEKALAQRDDLSLKTLFHPDSHWRDVLALTWRIRTVTGLDGIVRELKTHAGRASPTGFRTDSQASCAPPCHPRGH